jgi:predicted phage-related endonuclease
VELKTSSAFGREKWADGVPLYYEAQVQTQLAVLGAPYGWLAVLHGGNTPELFRVERDDEFIVEHLIPKTRAFWEDHVLAKVAPEASTAMEHASLFTPDPEKTIELAPTLEEALDRRAVLLSDALAEEKEAKAKREEADAIQLAVLNYAGDAQYITIHGKPRWEIRQVKGRRSVSVADVEQKHPELYGDLVKTGNPRTVLSIMKDTK